MLTLPLRAEQVTIFAASSLKTALDRVIERNTLDVVAVYGGSAAMARQVAQGAQADIIILAHPIWMDWLERQSALTSASRCNLLGNALVLAGGHTKAPFEPETVQDVIENLKDGRLAVGELRSVPAGQYTAEYLKNIGWLEQLRPHLAQTSNVRLALALIARGETELGFVYASDVHADPDVQTVFTPSPSKYSKIRYPMALTASVSEAGRSIAAKLAGEIATFAEFGFAAIPADEAGRCS